MSFCRKHAIAAAGWYVLQGIEFTSMNDGLKPFANWSECDFPACRLNGGWKIAARDPRDGFSAIGRTQRLLVAVRARNQQMVWSSTGFSWSFSSIRFPRRRCARGIRKRRTGRTRCRCGSRTGSASRRRPRAATRTPARSCKRERPRHRVRGGRLPQHRRVLGQEARHLHDHGRHLHARLRVLQRQDRHARRARRRRAGACGRGGCKLGLHMSSSPRSIATISPTAAPSISPRPSARSARAARPPPSRC